MIDYIKILKIIRNKAYTSTDQFKYEEQQYVDANYPKRFVSDREKMAKLTNLGIFLGLIAIGLTIIWCHIMFDFDLDTLNDFINVFVYFAPIIVIFIMWKIYHMGADCYDKTELLKKELGQEFRKAKQVEIGKHIIKNLTSEDITDNELLNFFKYDCKYESNIDEVGNLYKLPIDIIIKETNIKSVKNLHTNIVYLTNYYNNHYIKQDFYAWITTYLNRFYNSTVAEKIDNDEILQNLHN